MSPAATHARTASRNIVDLPVECSAGRVSSTKPCAAGGSHAVVAGFDGAGNRRARARCASDSAKHRQARMRRRDFGEQRFADFVVGTSSSPASTLASSTIGPARAFLFEAALDRREHRGLFEHDERVASR